MTNKKFVIISLSSVLLILFIISITIIIIDPFFHYRNPNQYNYVLNQEWYQNDGIVKHFNYDAIITGTSMTENFKTSEFDELWNTKSIKVAYAGAMFKEINDLLVTATDYNKNIKIILRCLDLYKLNEPKDKTAYDEKTYPYYLYDNIIINDIKYVTNKNALTNVIESLINSIMGFDSTTFDEYSTWYNECVFSEKNVIASYKRVPKNPEYTTSSTDYQNTLENIQQNVIDLALKYPDIDFYLFYPPYSIYYWDNLNQLGVLNMQIDCIEYTTKLLLEHSNIHLYSFLDEYDIINNLNNYKDVRHYSEKINSIILNKMKKKDNLITLKNYATKMKEIREYYNNYDYEKLF